MKLGSKATIDKIMESAGNKIENQDIQVQENLVGSPIDTGHLLQHEDMQPQQCQFLKITKTYDQANVETLCDAESAYRQGVSFQTVAKDHVKAEHMFRISIACDPAFVPALYGLAVTLTSKGSTEAESIFTRLLQIDPENAFALNGLGLFMTDVSKDHDKAEFYFRRALRCKPQFAPALDNLGTFFRNVKGDLAEAIKLYRSAIVAAPYYENGLCNLALLLQSAEPKSQEAEELYCRILEINPNHIRGLSGLGSILLAKGDKNEEAESLFRRALAVQSDDVPTLFNLAGLCWRVKGAADEAEILYRQLIGLPMNSEQAVLVHFGLAELLHRSRSGDPSEAASWYRSVLSYDPQHAKAAWGLSTLLAGREQAADAELLSRGATPISFAGPSYAGVFDRSVGRKISSTSSDLSYGVKADLTFAPPTVRNKY